jgi:hypothetical protein
MKRYLAVTAAALAVGFSANYAAAQHTHSSPCGFEHPKQAKQLKSSMVQAHVSCGNPGGNVPNSMTETGVPTCAPPETFREQNGSAPQGWSWNELNSKGDISIKAAKNKRTTSPFFALSGGSNDSADIDIQVKLSGVVDSVGPATGTGNLATLSRATLRDRQGTPDDGDDDNGDENADDVPMTVIDFPVQFSVPVSEGKATVKTTANASVETLTARALPKCTSVEVVDISITDENGDTFARLGTLLGFK